MIGLTALARLQPEQLADDKRPPNFFGERHDLRGVNFLNEISVALQNFFLGETNERFHVIEVGRAAVVHRQLNFLPLKPLGTQDVTVIVFDALNGDLMSDEQ